MSYFAWPAASLRGVIDDALDVVILCRAPAPQVAQCVLQLPGLSFATGVSSACSIWRLSRTVLSASTAGLRPHAGVAQPFSPKRRTRESHSSHGQTPVPAGRTAHDPCTSKPALETITCASRLPSVCFVDHLCRYQTPEQCLTFHDAHFPCIPRSKLPPDTASPRFRAAIQQMARDHSPLVFDELR
jgi:hypothetical protein